MGGALFATQARQVSWGSRVRVTARYALWLVGAEMTRLRGTGPARQTGSSASLRSSPFSSLFRPAPSSQKSATEQGGWMGGKIEQISESPIWQRIVCSLRSTLAG